MHLAFAYILIQALDDESRRANGYLPDPDPSVEPDDRPARVGPSSGRRSPFSALGGLAAAVRGGASRIGRRLAPEA
jgi:hypothetical protein